ncbi:hypothetical protein ACEQUB_00114 [Ralstonia syzygii]
MSVKGGHRIIDGANGRQTESGPGPSREWQRDWARRDTYDAVMQLVKEHSGAYGMGVDYAYTMVHKAPQRTASQHKALAAVAAG